MNEVSFSGIAAKYEHYSLLQKSAADVLLELLEIGDNNDDVLDLGCGVGNLTRKIRGLTRGRVVGVDPSEGMVKEAKEKSKGLDITFVQQSAEGLDYEDCFSVILCNSALQWFGEPQKAVEKCHIALRRGGRIGVQAPARRAYCPNFIEAVERVREDPRTNDTFAHFKEPWFFLETAGQYADLFEKHRFRVLFSRIESVRTKHPPEEVFNIFSSGAAVGYLNQDYYDVQVTERYVDYFKDVVVDAFAHQANNQGVIVLVFNRIFLVAIKG